MAPREERLQQFRRLVGNLRPSISSKQLQQIEDILIGDIDSPGYIHPDRIPQEGTRYIFSDDEYHFMGRDEKGDKNLRFWTMGCGYLTPRSFTIDEWNEDMAPGVVKVIVASPLPKISICPKPDGIFIQEKKIRQDIYSRRSEYLAESIADILTDCGIEVVLVEEKVELG